MKNRLTRRKIDLSTTIALVTLFILLFSLPLFLSLTSIQNQLSRFGIIPQAQTPTVNLLLSNVSTSPGSSFDLPILLANSSSSPLRGVDLKLRFNPQYLTLLSLNPIATSSTSFKTYLPTVKGSNGSFDEEKVIVSANTTGVIDFGLITFDYATKATTAPFTQSTQVAVLRFQAKPTLSNATTTVSFIYAIGASDETNIIPASNPPYDLLVDPAQLVNSQITISVLTPTPTSTPIQ